MMFNCLLVIFSAIFGNGVQSASLFDIARDVRSDRVLLDSQLRVSVPNQVGKLDSSALDVPVGGALDVFYRFGFYSLSVRVVPRDDPGAWLVREPTAKVFDDSSVVQIDRQGSNSFSNQPFQVFLCEDLNELYEAYFRDFRAEGVDQPHKLFTGSWRIPIAAKYLGLSPEILVSDSSFVLVKLVKETGSKTVSGNLRLKPEATEYLQNIQPGNTDAILEFVQRYGSHFIREITVGDVVYQVFAISREQFQQLNRIIGNGVNTIGLTDWRSIYDLYLSPWLVREVGEIKTASGDLSLQRFLDQELRVSGQFGTYPHLVESLIENPDLVNRLESLSGSTKAVTGLTLSSLRSYISDPTSQQIFDETINTHSSLFEVNV